MIPQRLELLRFLAGRGRVEILAFFMENRRRRESINGLARAVGIPVATTWQAAHDLHDLGLVLFDRVANTVLVSLNQASPVIERLEKLFELDLAGPHRMAYEHFARRAREILPGVEVNLFGSVARGTARPSSDVDIEVAYGASGLRRERVEGMCTKIANEVLDRYGVPVTAVVLRRRSALVPS